MECSKISDHLFVFGDYVNVYIVKSGERAILIDFGSGSVLDHLAGIGVHHVDYILHTHYHRDQCQGDPAAVARGIKVVAPRRERRLFTDAEDFWKTRSYYDIYALKPTFLVPTSDIPLDRTVEDGDTFRWASYDIRVIETAGHTTGSVSYLLESDGTNYAFTGDLIHQGGKVITYHDLEYSYVFDFGYVGILKSLKSFKRLLKRDPDVLLPSHGPAITDPRGEIEALKAKFEVARKTFRFTSMARFTDILQVVTRSKRARNLLFNRNTRRIRSTNLFPRLIHEGFGTTAIILGTHRNCMLVDFPGSGPPLHYDRDGLLSVLARHGVDTIDLVIPTHYHDDHVGGIPLLQREFGVEVHALEQMVDVLENPTHYRIGCLIDTPIKVDSVVEDGGRVRWDDLEFTLYHFPGQTEWHAAILVEIDEKRICFVGDSLAGGLLKEPDTNLICINFCWLGKNKGTLKCIDLLLDLNPDYLLISHYGLLPFDRDAFLEYREIASQYKSIIASLVPWEDPNMGFDPNWTCFKPIRIITRPGEEVETCLVVKNFLDRESTARIEVLEPAGWRVYHERGAVTIPARTFHEIPVTVQVPGDADPSGRTMIVANMTWNGTPLGPIADLMVDHGFQPGEDWRGWTPGKKDDLIDNIVKGYAASRAFFR